MDSGLGVTDTVEAMADPDYLSPTVAAEGRDLCAQLLEPDADVYWRAVDVFSLFGRALPDDAPGRLYVVWGKLTDIWELEPERRPEADKLMREAAREFLVIGDDTSELDRYLSRWYGRLQNLD
jgi:hypothetical protein